MQFSLRWLLLAMTALCLLVWSFRPAILSQQTVADGRLVGHLDVDDEPFETMILVVPQTGSGSGKMAATGPDGDFAIQLPPGIYDFYASLEGLDDAWDSPPAAWKQVSVLPGKTIEIPPLRELVAVHGFSSLTWNCTFRGLRQRPRSMKHQTFGRTNDWISAASGAYGERLGAGGF